MQAEQDRLETVQKGVIIHRRSPWDDFAQAQFVQKIALDQKRMDKVTISLRRAYKMADNLPEEKAKEVRRFLTSGYSPEVLATGDTKKAGKVLDIVYGIAAEHWGTEKAKADADAQWADTCLYTAETVKKGADTSLMLMSIAGGPAVNNVYQGITGYIEGGPKEAFLRVGASYNQLTGIAVDGYRGFETAVQQGGGWNECFQGAAWEITQGLIMEKAMSIGIGGAMRGYGAIKNARLKGKAPAVNNTRVARTPEVIVAKVKNKPSNVPDNGFNKSLTQADMKTYKNQIADGRNKVNSYKKTFNKLETARRNGESPEKIKKILKELDDRSAKIHSSPQAKMMMKTYQRNPKNREMVKRYCNSMDRVHRRVEKVFQEKMSEQWGYEKMKPIRNADSGRSVNMDYDIARDVPYDSNGRQLSPMKNGKPVSEVVWMNDAQKKWNEAYRETTGQSPEHSWETITTASHAEAYKDRAIITKVEDGGGVLQANKRWAEQTADVNQFKGDHLTNSPDFKRVEKHVEIARSTSKECEKRLFTLLDSKAPPKKNVKSYQQWQKQKAYWEKMNGVLKQMGNGRISPLEGDRQIRLISGGKSSLEVTHDLRNFMEVLLKW